MRVRCGGEFRKSIGETLVIISHHATACKLCRPFERKVLIDDVYSGGKPDDGDYMLLSEAMKLGLFHPRCRHGLGTYYPELEEINHYNNEENEVSDYGRYNRAHIENMVQRYKRLAVGSVAHENVARYRAKLEEWEQKLSISEKMVDNAPKTGRLKINIQLFARKSSDFSTVYLPKKEYAHVMSEIRTWATESQLKKRVFTKPIGNYIYTVENLRDGDFRIIGKELIE